MGGFYDWCVAVTTGSKPRKITSKDKKDSKKTPKADKDKVCGLTCYCREIFRVDLHAISLFSFLFFFLNNCVFASV